MFTEADEEAALIAAWRHHRRAFRRVAERTGSWDAAVDELNSHLTLDDLISDLKQLDPSPSAFKRNAIDLARRFGSGV